MRKSFLFGIGFLAWVLLGESWGIAGDLYFSTARKGQEATYFLLDSLAESSHRFGKVEGLSKYTDYSTLKPGDTVVYNIYSRFEVPLDELKARGVRILVDVEITGPQHLPVLDSTVRYLTDYTLLTSTEYMAKEIKSRWPESQVVLNPHVEEIAFQPGNRKLLEAFPSLKEKGGDRTILLAHQFPDWGDQFVDEFFKKLDAIDPEKKTAVVLALHPHETDVDAFVAKYGSRAKTIVLLSADQFETEDFFPYVDGVVTHSSTTGDLARTMGISTLSSVDDPNLESLGAFVQGLDPNARAERNIKIQARSKEALARWLALMSGDENCLKAHLYRLLK